MKYCGMILTLILCLLLLIQAPNALAAEPDVTVFVDSVNGQSDNDGLTEATAVSTIEEAYAALKNALTAQGKASDATAVGKVVLVNDYRYEFAEGALKKYIATENHTYQVIITGKTADTSLQFYLPKQSYYGMRGPTTFENMNIRLADDTKNQYFTIHGKGKLTIGEGVTTSSNTKQRPALVAAPYVTTTDASFDLEVNSGEWNNVYAGGYIMTMTGKANLVMNGGYAARIATNYNGTQNGEVSITLNGGTVDKVLTASVNSSGKVNNDITLNLNGGTIVSEFNPNGVGTYQGTTTINVTPNHLQILCPGQVSVNNVFGGTLTLGSSTELVVTESVSGTVGVTVDKKLRSFTNYVTAPLSAADDAFTFSQAQMTVTADTVKTWSNQDSSAFTGLVLKAPTEHTVKLYPGVSGGSVVSPDMTRTVDGIRYDYYANLMGTYRYISTRTGYYSVTKVVYMSEDESLTETVVDATTGKRAGTGYEPVNVKDYSDEMLKNKPDDETAAWWDEYSQYLNTPVFQSGRADHQMTSHEEMENYLADLDGSADNMYIYSMGKSYKNGYNMPIVIFSATDLSGAKTLEEAAELINANNKVTVHYQAQIHGNEPAGGEAALAVIGMLNSNWGNGLLETLNIYVIPRLNPDGSYLFQRNDTNNINMNRDMLLAFTQEIRQHHYVYQLFYPELAIDSHEYTYQPELASSGFNDIMVASGHNGNSGEAFVQYSEMFARLPFQAMYDNEMQPAYYANYTNGKYSASGTNYRGTRGSVSLLLESRGIGAGKNTMARRVVAHVISMETILNYAAENHAQLQAASDAERRRIAESGKTYEETDIIVLEHAQISDSSLSFKNCMYDLASGVVTSTYNSTPKAYRAAIDGRTRARPTAYVIPAGESWTQDVLDLMDIQDISYYYVSPGKSISLQQYTGTIEAAVLTAEQYYTFEQGCYVLPMNQSNATILAILMEPDIADEHNVDAGGTSATVPSGTLAQMDIIPSENEVFPIYRYVRDLNAQGAVDTVILPDAPTGLSAAKITVAGAAGSITGFDPDRLYEYRNAADSVYTQLEAGTTTLDGLSLGTYYVRFAAVGTALPSSDVCIEISYGVLEGYTVYIDSANGSDENDGYSENTPVATIAKAFAQLDSIMADAPQGACARVVLLANYSLGSKAFTFPTHDYPVVFTAKDPSIALTKGGSAQADCYTHLSGDITFEHITLKIVGTGEFYNLNANGYNVVMGEGITCVTGSKGKSFMLAAGCSTNMTGTVPSTNLTVKSGTWEYIYAGGYTGKVSGDANLTITGGTVKTAVLSSYNGAISGNVNINISGANITTLYGGHAKTATVSGNVNITLGEGAKVTTLYAGSRDSGNVSGTVTVTLDGADLTGCKLIGKAKNTTGTVGSSALLLKRGTLATISNFTSVTLQTTGYVKLAADVTKDMTVRGDSYLDLNGHTLTGDLTGTGTLHGMDSTGDEYALPAGRITGTASCRIAKEFKTDVTGAIKRYLTIADASGYTFHRIYVGVTHMSLKPTNTGVGYKAVFAADSAVQALFAESETYGFTLWVGDAGEKHTFAKNAETFVSGETLSLRLQNFDVANYGETKVYGQVFMKLSDGTVIESSTYSYTLRELVESVAGNLSAYSAQQLTALQAMITANDNAMKDWDIDPIRNYTAQ